MSDSETMKNAVEQLPVDLLGGAPPVPPKKKTGRPKGRKDSSKRIPAGMELTKVSELKDKKLSKKDMLFAKEIERLGFDTAHEMLKHYWMLVKSLGGKIDKKTGVVEFSKEVNDRIWQVSDMLKAIASLQFAKLKAVELAPNTGDRVTMNFNLTATPVPVEQQEGTAVQNNAFTMLQGSDGTFQLPVPEHRAEGA